MPRIRSVHPELCEDETLADLSASAERTFIRLWPHLDDDGRAEDRPKLWKSRLYPVHDDMTVALIAADLDELHRAGLLIRYEIEGKHYLCAKPDAWKRWQRPQRPTPSKIPESTPDSIIAPRDVREPSATPPPVVEGRVGETEQEGEGCGEGDRAEHEPSTDPPQPPAERGEHDGSHPNCRACGTNPRGPARPVPSWPPMREARSTIPPADPILAEMRSVVPSPPPPGWRKQVRRAQ